MYQYVKSSPAPVLACHPPSRWISQRQADGHDATHAPPAATLAPVPPTGGAVAPVAPTCANAGQFWEPSADSILLGEISAGALRVARHSAKPVSRCFFSSASGSRTR